MSKKLTINQLITDPSFVNWANNSNAKDRAKWEAFRKANPDLEELLDDARMMVSGFNLKKPEVSDNQIDKSWDSFASKLNVQPQKQTPVISLRRRLLKIAAIFLVLAASVWGIQNFLSPPELIVFRTSQNASNTVELPDGSKVILNTNSRVSFYENWADEDIRKINLEGEAYFEVKKQSEGKIFLIENKNLTVKVVGTAFNFNAKRKEPIVSLTEGKVLMTKLGFGEQILEEGQTARFNSKAGQFEISEDQTDYWKAWTLQKWEFGESTPITEILLRIEETFDLKTSVTDESVLKKSASGDVSIESPEILFESLSYLLGVKMEIEKDELIISTDE